jgi:argininosuccinate lyase
VGRAVAVCLERQIRLEDLSLSDLQELHEGFDEEAIAALDPRVSLAKRDLPGAPHPERVREAIGEARAKAAAHAERALQGGPSALERSLALGEEPA